jgi:hypothetical protein
VLGLAAIPLNCSILKRLLAIVETVRTAVAAATPGSFIEVEIPVQ